MTKTRLNALCELAKSHDISPYNLTEHDIVYTLSYRGKPLYAHYCHGKLYCCIYNSTQYRFVSGVGRGNTSMTTVYRMYNCNTVAWLEREESSRHYRDIYGEVRDRPGCLASEACDYADLIPIA